MFEPFSHVSCVFVQKQTVSNGEQQKTKANVQLRFAFVFSMARLLASTESAKLKRYSHCWRACHSARCNCSSCHIGIPFAKRSISWIMRSV